MNSSTPHPQTAERGQDDTTSECRSRGNLSVSESRRYGSADSAVPANVPEREPSEELLASGRDGRGRFTANNLGGLRHGGRSKQVQGGQLPEQAEALAALAERRQTIEADLGGTDQLSLLTRDVLNRYLELTVVADYLGGRLVTEGPLTTTGRQRAALTAYLGVVDRQTKLATTLGLSRRVRDVGGLEDWLSGGEG